MHGWAPGGATEHDGGAVFHALLYLHHLKGLSNCKQACGLTCSPHASVRAVCCVLLFTSGQLLTCFCVVPAVLRCCARLWLCRHSARSLWSATPAGGAPYALQQQQEEAQARQAHPHLTRHTTCCAAASPGGLDAHNACCSRPCSSTCSSCSCITAGLGWCWSLHCGVASQLAAQQQRGWQQQQQPAGAQAASCSRRW
jgi:hypothetical protein